MIYFETRESRTFLPSRMRLSQIKISGFKSFVDPTRIVFPTNITGIVGPNGCGKSNVIDAVRWVMGESSAKNLRGDSMEDVIFSGSAARKPVGQASVELIFDNTDGRVKGEYAKYNEISVKRLATRAGHSKYYLNNTHCRRRDIADIFLGTGLGPRSYSIIEQGMVSRIIDSKPEDLRVYLEEAAGISKYKERRRETEKRIRHTRENLERLVDLIEEIDKQLNRLERQSQSAEKYKLFKQEQRRLEAENLLLQKMSYDSDISEQGGILGKFETSMQEQIAGYRNLEKQIGESRQQYVEASDRHNQIQGQYYQLGSDISNQEQNIEHQKNLRQHNIQELENIRLSMADSNQVIELDREKLEKLEGELKLNEPCLEELVKALEVSEQLSAQRENDVSTWQEKWDLFNRDFHQVHEAAQIENRGIEHIERQVQQSGQRRQRLQEELLTLDTTQFDREIESFELAAGASDQEYAAMLEGVESSSADIQKLRGQIENQSAELDQKRSKVQTMRGRLSSLEALQQHLLAEASDEVQHWLKRYQIDSGKRLTELLKVKDNFEKAVEAVLGPFLSAYCVEPGKAIPDDGLPNYSIALLDRQKSRQPAAQARDWTALIELIECDIDLTALLSGIYVCRDLQELSQRRAQLEPGESLVTAEGLWAGPNWILRLGEEDQRSGMLSREQEISSLRLNLDEINNQALVLNSQTEGDRERLQQAEQQRDEDQRELGLLQQTISENRNQLTQRKGRLEQLQTRFQQLQQEIDELVEIEAKHSTELKTNSSKRNEYLDLIEKMSADKLLLLKQKSEIQDSLTESRSGLQDCREKYHQLQMQLQSCQSEISAARSNVDRLVQQNQQFSVRSEDLNKSVEAALEPMAALENSLQQLLQSRSQNEQSLAQSQETVTTIDNRQREFESEKTRHSKLPMKLAICLKRSECNARSSRFAQIQLKNNYRIPIWILKS
jgi:chromosome segregation protein